MLYKYLDPDRMDVLSSNCIRFTQPADFNDPFEFKPVVSTLASKAEMDEAVEREIEGAIKAELGKIPRQLRALITPAKLEILARRKYSVMWPDMERQFESMGSAVTQTFSNKANELIGVLSLSEKSNNLLMWSHYARSHKGFCIGFDENDCFFNRKRSDSDEFYHLRKVNYTRERPSSRVTQLSGIELFLVKSDDWIYEQEWRMCAVLSDAKKVIEAEPYPIHLFEFPKAAVKEVIFGACMESRNKYQVLDIVKSKYEHVIVKQAVISKNEFKVDFVAE